MVAHLLFANNASSRLYQATPAGSGTIRVEAGDGNLFPIPADGNTFKVTLEDRRTGQIEICECTARAGDILTVTRGQEGTVAQDFALGATVSNRLTAQTLDILISAAGVPEAPQDTRIYGRRDAGWIETLDRIQIETSFALKAPINSPTFTGDPKAPTPAPGDNDQSIATTAFVTAADSALNALIQAELDPKLNDAPSDGNAYARRNAAWQQTVLMTDYTAQQAAQDAEIATLDARADANDTKNATQDSDLVSLDVRLDNAEAKNTTQDSQIASANSAIAGLQTNKANINSPVFTGDPQAPTPATADNDTSIATTAYVKANIALVPPFPEAPTDGQQYARQNAAWAAINVPPATKISDTPPAGPAQGQLWWESDSGDMFIWYDDGSGAQWVQVNGPGYATVAISDTPPADKVAGTLWFESDTGRLFTWYTDADSSQWVQINGPFVPEYIASTSVDMWAGFKTGGKFVVNTQADGLGSDYFQVTDTGVVSVGGGVLNSLSNTLVLAPGTSGNLYLRPQGWNVTTGQWQLDSNGTLTAPVVGSGYPIVMVNGANNLYLGPSVISMGPSISFQLAGSTKLTCNSTGNWVFTVAASGYTINSVGNPGGGSLFYCTGSTQYGICGYNNGSGSNYSFYGNTGALLSAGTWATSDARAKENITDIDPATSLEVVKAIKAHHYFNKLSDMDECGWIAQEVMPHIPEAVHEDLIPEMDTHTRGLMGLPLEGEQSMFTMNDKSMIAHLWAAVQALAAKIEQLEAERGV